MLGLALATLALRGGHIELVDGCLEAHGPLLGWSFRHFPGLQGGMAAITLGHVVLARDADAIVVTRAHERVHVVQYERWGPFFVPAYLAASLWALLRGRDPYYHNWFEIEARLSAGE